MKLVLATNNEGKVREFARILEPLGILSLIHILFSGCCKTGCTKAKELFC